MQTHDPKSSPDAGAERFETKKKPYVKPAFRHERVFETMALACGKISTTQSSCRASRKNS
jgi:hypothetical protein